MKEAEMRKVLELALNPTDDVETIRALVKSIGTWLTQESDKKFK